MKREVIVLSLAVACLFIGTTAFSQPLTGSWDSYSSSFNPGNWYEVLIDGQQGNEGNELGAQSSGIYILYGPKLAKVELIREPDELNSFFEYLTFYFNGIIELKNIDGLPWYNEDTDQDIFIANMKVSRVVTKKYVDDYEGVMEFFITTNAVFKNYPELSVEILAKYRGTPTIVGSDGIGENDLIMQGDLEWVKITISGTIADINDVAIDIKPGADDNCININEHGVIPIAILGSIDFDVSKIDPGTCELAGMTVKMAGKSNKYLSNYEDVNQDGFDDLVIKIEDNDANIDLGEGTVKLTCELYDGKSIEGTDTICLVLAVP